MGPRDLSDRTSPHTRTPFRTTFTHPRLRNRISLENATLFVDAIEAIVDLVNDPDEVQTETRDPNDDDLIAPARAHDVGAISSGDEDLLEWEEQSPPVIAPAQFEDRGSVT